MTASNLEALHRRRAAATHGAGHILGKALATLREWRRRIRGRAELAAMSDRMLQDIGITRAEAQYLSRKPFWRE
jgi:uncharacterized protein YjiS (DUF1127 family)